MPTPPKLHLNGHANGTLPKYLRGRLKPIVSPRSPILEAALALHDRGLWVVPCDGKRPILPEWDKTRLSKDELRTKLEDRTLNIAIELSHSDLIDIECDSSEAEAKLNELCHGKIPRTPTYQSKRGKHRWLRQPAGLPEKAMLEIDGIEFRIGNGKGALSIVPPSYHPDGPTYQWLTGLNFDEVEPAELPSHVVELLVAQGHKPAVVRDAIANGTRNQILFRLGCAMRAHGAAQEAIERALLIDNDLRCDPPLSEAEIKQIAKSAVAYDSGCVVTDQRNTLNYLITLRPSLGEAAYFGFVGDFIRALAPYTEAPDAGILGHLLPAIATMIGPGPHVAGGDEQPARINTTLAGPSSQGRKGTSKVGTDKLLREMDYSFWEEQVVSGLSSGEGLIQKVTDRRYEDKDGNRQVEVVDKRVWVVEPEFSRVLANTRREGNILSQVLRETYDSGNLHVLTRNPLAATGAHICITGHITPEELRQRFSELDMANGFGNRFLWLYCESSRELPDAPPIPDKIISTFAKRLSGILRFAQKQERLERAEEANEIWRNVYSYLRMDKPGLQGAMLARGPSIVLRLSLIYALLDESPLIRRQHLEAALAVWQFNEESVRLLFSNKVGDSLQDKLLDLLVKGPMTSKQFFSHVAKPAKDIRAALDYLASVGRVRKTTLRHKGAGRPAEQWELIEAEGP